MHGSDCHTATAAAASRHRLAEPVRADTPGAARAPGVSSWEGGRKVQVTALIPSRHVTSPHVAVQTNVTELVEPAAFFPVSVTVQVPALVAAPVNRPAPDSEMPGGSPVAV